MGKYTSFNITYWHDGAYRVSIPNYGGGTVYTAEHVARLTRENEAMRKALKAVIGLQPYINNPSAWDHFDDEMSERLGTIVDGALASLKEPTDAQA